MNEWRRNIRGWQVSKDMSGYRGHGSEWEADGLGTGMFELMVQLGRTDGGYSKSFQLS